MSDFTKTLIVDIYLPANDPINGKYKYLSDAAWALNPDNSGNGGTIIVEQGTYEINGDPGKETIEVPSNVTIIGRGNAVIEVTASVPAFVNYGQTLGTPESNDRITISGFKIELKNTSEIYGVNLIDFQDVSNCVLEDLTISTESGRGVWPGDYDESLERKYTVSAIYLTGNSNTIEKCTILNFGRIYNDGEDDYNNYGYGIHLTDSSSDNVIKNNFVSSCSNNVYLYESDSNIIKNNIIERGKTRTKRIVDGGEIAYTPQVSSNCLIERCDGTICTGNISMDSDGSHGLYTSHCKKSTFSGNILINNYNMGIHINGSDAEGETTYTLHNTYTANMAINNGGYGMDVLFRSSYNSIVGNVCTNNDIGIVEYYRKKNIEGVPELSQNVQNLFVGNMCLENIELDVNDIPYNMLLSYDKESIPVVTNGLTNYVAADNLGLREYTL